MCPQTHYLRDARQLASPVTFLHLTIDQLCCYLPAAGFPASATNLEPLSKMSGQRIEVQIEPVTGEERNAERRRGFVGGNESRHGRRFACADPDAGREGSLSWDRWPPTATGRGCGCAVSCAVRPTGHTLAADDRTCARGSFEHAAQRE
jgi:hypothetical protein